MEVSIVSLKTWQAVVQAALVLLLAVQGVLLAASHGALALFSLAIAAVLTAAAVWVFRSHSALEREIVWLKGTLDAVPQPITVTDMNMRWIFVNKVVEGLLGKSCQQIRGRHCSEWGAAICKTDKCGIRSLRSGRPRTEYMQTMPDGSSRAMTVDASYITDQKGRRIGHVEIVTDSHAGYELQSIYSRIASSLEEVSSTMTEMDAQVKENAAHASQANQSASAARTAIRDGRGKVDGLADAMRHVSQTSRRILGINKTVDEIAFQTNLLALNAAVEAARAGEAGAGFAVVAEEVRSLARKAADAARETSELITTATNDIQAGASLAEEASTALSSIESSAGQLDSLVDLIAQASAQQSTGISAVSQAIHDLERSTLAHVQNTTSANLVQIK